MMRATIHLVSKRDYWPFVVGIREGLHKWWLRVHKGVTMREISANDRKVRRALRGKTLSRAELEEVIGQRLGPAGLFVDLVRVPPSGTWERRRADLYALAEDWVGPENATAQEGIEHLVRRYLQGFGPARPTEIADWASLDVLPDEARARTARFAPLPGRAGQGARRPPAPPAARCRHARAGPLPPGVGCHAPRPRAADSDPPREVPLTGLQRANPPLREHVPRRRPGRRDLEAREGTR